MRFIEDKSDAAFQIKAVTDDSVTIGETIYSDSFILSPTLGVKPWSVDSHNAITLQSLKPIIALQPEILLIGTGPKSVIIPPEKLAPLYKEGIAIECMNTRAACRTFTVLIAENRPVVAAIILPKKKGRL